MENNLTISMSEKPDITRFFKTSQPMPPAPTTSSLLLFILSWSDGSNTPAICAMLMIVDLIFCFWNNGEKKLNQTTLE